MNYLVWLFLFVWSPLILMWVLNWRYLLQYKHTVLCCIGWALLFSIPWDVWAVRTQIWLFPSDTNVGFWIAGLPLEEYLFMIFVTMMISTVTLLLKRRLERRGQADGGSI